MSAIVGKETVMFSNCKYANSDIMQLEIDSGSMANTHSQVGHTEVLIF